MKKLVSLVLLALVVSCKGPSENPSGSPNTQNPTPNTQRLKIGYVLHGLNDFTAVIRRGAEDAGRALNVDVEVVGPSKFDAHEATGQFEAMIQKHKDGLAVIPMPGEVWVRPIKEATDAGIPVVTANITSVGSSAESWFGQDEYQSGITMAEQLKKQLDAQGTKSGTVLTGNCKPGVAVLDERYKGFKQGLQGSGLTPTDPKDVGTEPTANYSAWENQVTANPTIVAAVGLCSMDIPNLANLKQKTKAKWLVGGYDLTKVTLDSVKSGETQVLLGQNPYLQGYLPVLALVRRLRDKTPLPNGWVNVGTEIITKDNVEQVYPRETDTAVETKWYADHVAKQFANMNALAKPVPKTH